VTLRDPRELLAYAVLGVFGGIASLVFTMALGWLRPLLRRQSAGSQLMQPAIAGLLVGCIGYFGLPQVMGAGYEAIDQAMHAQFTWQVLLLLAGFKIVATTLSFSSGTPGGMFAPTLFIGAMLGAAVGSFETHLFPHLTGSVGSYALVGMGVLFAAFLRAPLTSVFMVLEVSQNYSIVLPVILANTIAYLVSRSLQPVPILEIFTHQDGLDLPSMEEQREESNLRLEDALHPIAVPVLQGSDTFAATAAVLEQYGDLRAAPAMLIHCSDGLWYAARRDELEAILKPEPTAAPEAEAETLEHRLGAERTPLLFPDLPLASALPHFERWPLLPVTNRAVRGALEGAVSLDDVLRRYQQR
jgi:chloride channel protein, CIC family